jgi:hypothetical protein
MAATTRIEIKPIVSSSVVFTLTGCHYITSGRDYLPADATCGFTTAPEVSAC